MKALITGITGFLGSHLAEHLLAQGVEVEGTTHYPLNLQGEIRNLAGSEDKITVHEGFLMTDYLNVQSFFENREYDYIFHMATERFLSSSWILNANIIGTANLLEAVCKLGQHPVIIIVGCGEMYGCPPLVEERIDRRHGFMGTGFSPPPKINYKPNKVLKLPITEDFPLNPVSTYCVSKAAQDMLGFQYHKEFGMRTVMARAFDITGPRSHQSLLTSSLAKQMVEIEKGTHEPEIKIASPEYVRDYTDVRDVARALWMAATKCRYGEAYNICSSKGRTVQQVIDILRMQSTAQFEVVQEKTMMHPNDIIALTGDCTKFYKKTGWKPETGFAKSMGDLLEWWRQKP